MPEDNVEHIEESESRLDRIKEAVKQNWKPFAIGAGFTLVTVIVTRGVIRPYTPIHMKGTNLFMKKAIFKNSSLYQITNIHGAPYNRLSRIVKCVETGEIFPSIRQMANSMGLDPSHISRHLNYPEQYPDVKGYRFEDIGTTQFHHGNWS